ncbi:hypothetical protein MATL_G00093360 [Megalops atlanticus]|uniref:Uncharacterized protein n=1 Tax=Megalops atlanticus TaxID=7932 RepID=A0A9D3Q0F4_MEGAT|nr:hypothetical protein MATL_G00093360 [Megalops atlanticus]
MPNSDRVVLALGGAGTVGSGVVKALLDRGSEEGAEEAKRALLGATAGHVTDVVSSLGFSWWQRGPPHTQSLEELERVLGSLVLSTFVSWKTFFPLVRDNPGSTYTFITGGAGDKLLMPGTGFLTVGAAGALGLCQALREEYPDTPCKINQVKINTGVSSPGRSAPGYLDQMDLGSAVASLVERGADPNPAPAHSVYTLNGPDDLRGVLTADGV